MRSIDWLGTVGLGALASFTLANHAAAAVPRGAGATIAMAGTAPVVLAVSGTIEPTVIALSQSNRQRATDKLPSGLPFFIALRDGRSLVDQVGQWLADLDPDGPLAQAIDDSAQLNQARIGLMGLALASGLSFEEALETLVGNELALAFTPESDGAEARFILALSPSDPQALDRLLKQVHRTMGLLQKGEIGADNRRELESHQVVVLSEELLECRTENALLLSNDESLLIAALRIDSEAGNSLESSAAFRGSMTGDIVFGADLASTPSLLAAGLPEALENSFASILFGSELAALRGANHVSARIELGLDSLEAFLDVAGKEALGSELQALLPVLRRESAWRAEDLEGYLGSIAVRRNWADVFAEREAIMPLSQAGELVNFSGTMSALMGAVDFLEDVLARIDGPIRFMAAQRLDMAYPPAPFLPAMALIAPLGADLPAGLQQRLRAGATSALSIIALEDAQQGRDSILMDIDKYRGHRLVFGAYPIDIPKAKRGVRFNFSPAIAVVQGDLIVASTAEFLKRIIDQIEDSTTSPIEALAADTLSLHLPRLASILEDNYEQLRVNRMLKEDESRAEAGAWVDGLLGLLRLGGDVDYQSRPTALGFEMRLKLGLTLGR